MIMGVLAMNNFEDDADRWVEFENLLSQEDKANLESILKKAQMKADGGLGLNTTLTKHEKIWTTNFVWQAILWGLY